MAFNSSEFGVLISASQSINTRWYSLVVESVFFISWVCLIEITVFEPSSSGLKSTFETVITAGWVLAFIQLQLIQLQPIERFSLQFKIFEIFFVKQHLAA